MPVASLAFWSDEAAKVYHAFGDWKRHWSGHNKHRKWELEGQKSDSVKEPTTTNSSRGDEKRSQDTVRHGSTGGRTSVNEPLLQTSLRWIETRIRRRARQRTEPEPQDIERGSGD